MQAGWTIFNPTMKGTYAPYDMTMFNNGDPTLYSDVYTADLMGELTVDAIEQFIRDGAPFFIWTSQLPPHGMNVNRRWVPPIPAERHREAYPDAMPPAWGEPVFHEQDVSDKPPWVQNTVRADPEKMVRLQRARIRSLLSVDEQVRATVEALDQVGQLENTYIFFTSDNGYAVGEHGLTTKNHPYETSLRVPLLVRGPGIPAGVTRTGQFSLTDLSPTFLQIAEAEPGRRQDGRSMLPALTDGDEGYSHYLIQASGWSYVPGLKWWWRGVRSTDYTYVRYDDGFEELYDLRADPTQLQNVADDPAAAGVKADLSARLGVLEDCRGKTCQQAGEPSS
jgi:N-acetylglucosamine-6-sulfatase